MDFKIFAILTTLVSFAVAQQFTSTECGVSKACFQSPSGCAPSDANCYFVSWTYNSTTTNTVFELSGQPPANGYIAVAFTEIAGMATADTYICTANQFVSSTISSTTEPVDEPSLPTGVSRISESLVNGKVQCSFNRPVSVTKTISGTDIVFDFSAKQFYILVASGASDNAGGSIATYHSATKDRSSSTFDFTTGFEGGGAAGVSTLIKAHGALMILAWLLLSNLGILIARNYKATWAGQQVGGKDIWFQIHRGMMVTAVLSTIIAFILIFVDAGGLIDTSVSGVLAHVIIGFIVTAFAIANPIIAAFRPHPGTPNRKYFFWTHSLVGSFARGLGLANLFIGVGLAAMGLARYPFWILVGFTVLLFIVEVFVGFLNYYSSNSTKPQPESIDLGNAANETAKTPEKYGGLKKLTLILYALIALGCSIAIWVAIAQA